MDAKTERRMVMTRFTPEERDDATNGWTLPEEFKGIDAVIVGMKESFEYHAVDMCLCSPKFDPVPIDLPIPRHIRGTPFKAQNVQWDSEPIPSEW